jgi:hypothetical protein
VRNTQKKPATIGGRSRGHRGMPSGDPPPVMVLGR